MSKNFNFSEKDKANIKEAVQKVEKVSSGEIVVYFAQRSDDYQEVRWFSAAFFMLVGAILVAGLSYFWMLPFATTPVETSMVILGFFFTGFFISWLFPVSVRLLASQERLYARTMQRASEVFLNEEIFETRDRTGILIFTSYLEHQVHILADKGISKIVSQDQWTVIVDTILEGIKTKNLADGLVKGIAMLEKPLLDHGILIKPDDENELSDDIIIEQ